MKESFITTQNVARCREVCDELADAQSRIGPSLAMITGRAGRGKTEFARHYATNSSAVYVPPMNIRTPTMLLREICFELAKVKPARTDACLDVIKDEMIKERRVILIDEADLLAISVLEMMRNVNERYACPVVLIGEEGLKGKINSRRRLASRIRRHMEFSPVQQPDIHLFYSEALGLDISAEITGMLHRSCGGDWRPLMTAAVAIERAMRSSGLEEISTGLVKTVLNGNGRHG